MQTKSIGRYEIGGVLGRGATAVVYLARHRELDRYVALKELKPELADDPAIAERFLLEAQLAATLAHGNVVTVHDFFEEEGIPYIAMEHFERGTLRPFVGRLDDEEIFRVLEGLLAGLQHAEAKGVVHRDLKPENLMVTEAGSIKIADFGIAKAYRDATRRTETGTVLGSPAYIAPERAQGHGAGPVSDLYSVGIIAYELFTGEPPFHKGEPVNIVIEHIHAPVPPLRAKRPDVEVRLADWVHRLLAKDPAKRPQSAAEARGTLEPLVKPARVPLPPEPQPSPWRALYHPLNVGVALAVAIAGLALRVPWLILVAAAAYVALVLVSVREAKADAG
jgi:serine/threonine protein kinase